MIYGISEAQLGTPNYERAVKQHEAYTDALISCGLDVTVLDADDNFPDSTFVEDTALLTKTVAVLTRPGAPSRRKEIVGVSSAIAEYYENIEQIKTPGTLEAGDVMMVGSQYYIGLSNRTNENGAQQLISILNKYGMTGSTIKLEKFLHLKTGVAYLENNIMVTTGECSKLPEFKKYNQIQIPEEEIYAANSLWINGMVLIAAGFPKTKMLVESAGFETISFEMSEFQKLDGGLSCLSLRF